MPGAQSLLHNLLSRPSSGTPSRLSRSSVLSLKDTTTKSMSSSTSAVFSTIPVNIPRHSPIQQEVDDSGIRAKRKLAGTDTNRRPTKFARTDENTIDTLSNPNTFDFPNFKTVGSTPHQLVNPTRSNSVSGGERSLRDDDDDGGNDGDSDNESLFGDHEVLEIEPTMSVEDDDDDIASSPERQPTVAFTSSQLIPESEPKIVDPEKAVPQTQRPRRTLNSIIVVNWMNELRRFQSLQREKRLSWQDQDKLYDILKEINKERDNTYLTPRELARTNLGKVMKEIGRTKEFERRTWQLAKEIVKFWRQVCREAQAESA